MSMNFESSDFKPGYVFFGNRKRYDDYQKEPHNVPVLATLNAIISGQREELTFQNVKAKSSFLQGYLEDNGLTKENVAYMGDDLNDLFAMRHAGLCACPSDAAQEIKNQCGCIVEQKGGDGAVRGFIEIILKARGQWEQSIQRVFSES